MMREPSLAAAGRHLMLRQLATPRGLRSLARLSQHITARSALRTHLVLARTNSTATKPPAEPEESLFSTTWPFPDYTNVLSRMTLEPANTTCVKIEGSLESLVHDYVAQSNVSSFRMKSSKDRDSREQFMVQMTSRKKLIEKDAEHSVTCELGHSIFDVEWEGTSFFAVYQAVGHPVGLIQEVDMFRGTYLLAAGRQRAKIQAFCQMIVDSAKPAEKVYPTFTIYRSENDPHSGWKWVQEEEVRSRPLESVVLPKASKMRLLGDLDDFVAAKEWYTRHGVPYKRSFLMYGPPGTGKTSLVQALPLITIGLCTF